jgi:hypothetical protein
MPANGDSIQLFQNVLTFAGTPTMENLVVDAVKGLYWDTTDLASKGLLRVTTVSGMKNTDAPLLKAFAREGKIFVPGANDVSIYTLKGMRVDPSSRLSTGTYIVIADGHATKILVE